MRKLLAITFLLYHLCASVRAEVLFISERLSSTDITCICQDQIGYIWVGTEYGLNRFDGYRFVQYLRQPDDSTSLCDNAVTNLYCDTDGNLWVGTSKGLQRYNYAKNSFENCVFPISILPRIGNIRQLQDGRILVGTSGYGLFEISKGTNILVRCPDYEINEKDTYSNYFYEDAHQGFWKSGSNRFTYTPKGLPTRQLEMPFGQPVAFFEYEGRTTVLCRDNFMTFEGGEMKESAFDITEAREKGSFRTVLKDRSGNIYVGTRGNGLFWIPAGTRKLERYPASISGFDLNASTIWALAEDNQGNILVGCRQKGILIIPYRKSRFTSWSFSEQKVEIGTYVSSVCEGDGGIIWCTVQNKGVYGFSSSGQIIYSHPQNGAEFIYRDRNSRYWLGTDHGLYRYNPLTNHSELFSDFSCDKFNAMTDDGQGHYLISVYSKGIQFYDEETSTFRHFDMNQPEDSVRGRLNNNWVNAMMTDRDGRIWMATSAGVVCYDPQKETFRPFDWNVLDGNLQCLSLCELHTGDILIGTNLGLFVWRRHTNLLEQMIASKPLQNLIIKAIVQDDNHDIWCSTSSGIWHYRNILQRWVRYVSDSRNHPLEYSYYAGLHTSNDRIFLPTNDGLITFTPQQVRDIPAFSGEIQLTGLFMNGEPVSTFTESGGYKVTEKPFTESTHFMVSYLDNQLEFQFSLMNYADIANTVFEYRLNQDENWITVEEGHNSIKMSHMQSGTYNLEVRAVHNETYSESKIYTIEVAAPWYRTTPAYLLYVLVILGLTGIISWVWYRHVQLNLEEDKMKFLINATHDIRSPLTLIMGPLEKLHKRDLDADTQYELEAIDRNAKRILGLVNAILDVRKIDKNQMRLHCQETDMLEFVQTIYKFFECYAKERNITFTFEPQTEGNKKILAWIDRTQFDKVISNLLSNAFKYSYDYSDITVTLREGYDEQAKGVLKNFVEISIIDTGIGMKENTIKHLFDRFYQGKSSKSAHVDGTGIGLNLCKMIVDMHYGSITGKNRQDGQKGSIFTVRLPQGYSHLSEEEIERMQHSIKLKSQKSSSSYQILIVDDDEEIASYINKELGNYYHFSACRNGKEGVKELLTNTYHCVISDVMMPEMDGFTMLRMIRSNNNVNHLPVIMLTSKTDLGNRLEGLEKGADAYLTKPFSIKELHATIDNLIATRLRLRGKYTGIQQPTEQIKAPEIKGNDERLMERIIQCINNHLDDCEFNVEALCTEVGISRTNLHRKMKKLTGISIVDFIRNIRMEQAARLLSEKKLNITQVSFMVGYANLPYFSTTFRKHFGISPTEFVETGKLPQLSES